MHSFLQSLRPIIGDTLFVRCLYFIRTGKKLNLKNPITFNEKLQYLKLCQRISGLNRYVDKISARQTASAIIGNEHIIPLLGIWENAADIDFDSLPRPCVLKPSHYGGGGSSVVFLKDNMPFDRQDVITRLNDTLKRNIYLRFCEYPYRDVKPAILAEQMLVPSEGELFDYKFFCFGGKPLLLKIDCGRFTQHTANYYAIDGTPLEMEEREMPRAYPPPPIPDNLPEMADIAEKLAENFPFVRIDLYNCNNRIYFGEYTFFPASGLGDIHPREAQIHLGKLITLTDL